MLVFKIAPAVAAWVAESLKSNSFPKGFQLPPKPFTRLDLHTTSRHGSDRINMDFGTVHLPCRCQGSSSSVWTLRVWNANPAARDDARGDSAIVLTTRCVLNALLWIASRHGIMNSHSHRWVIRSLCLPWIVGSIADDDNEPSQATVLLNLGQQVSSASQWCAGDDNEGMKLLSLSLNGLAPATGM